MPAECDYSGRCYSYKPDTVCDDRTPPRSTFKNGVPQCFIPFPEQVQAGAQHQEKTVTVRAVGECSPDGLDFGLHDVCGSCT